MPLSIVVVVVVVFAWNVINNLGLSLVEPSWCEEIEGSPAFQDSNSRLATIHGAWVRCDEIEIARFVSKFFFFWTCQTWAESSRNRLPLVFVVRVFSLISIESRFLALKIRSRVSVSIFKGSEISSNFFKYSSQIAANHLWFRNEEERCDACSAEYDSQSTAAAATAVATWSSSTLAIDEASNNACSSLHALQSYCKCH